MLSSCVSKLARGRTATTTVKIATRNISQLGDAKIETANCAWSKSCYSGIDYTINQNSPVIDAVEKFAAYNVGALVTTDEDGKLSGVISERDYVTKIALLGKTGKTTKVKEVSTKVANLVTASPSDTVDACMAKMLGRDIRHLPLVEQGDVVGIISIKDLVKACLEEKDHTIHSLASFAVGEGGHFVM